MSASAESLARFFQLTDVSAALQPRYNIPPSQAVLAVRRQAGRDGRELVPLRWGLIPSWARDPEIGNRLINARAETAADKPSFRDAFRQRRCLVLADGFFEWKKRQGGKEPYLVRLHDGRPFAFAGLWERWRSPENEAVETCTILTTDANELVRPIHDRMPVILEPGAYELWLDPGVREPEKLRQVLGPYPASKMVAYPVSRRVNDPKQDDPRCLEGLPQQSPSEPQRLLF